jgi:APA family basic amino acid/polyamine antiporter
VQAAVVMPGSQGTPPAPSHAHLARDIGLLGLIATAFGAMIGIGINILPFMVQRSQPGVGDAVPLAYVVAALPAGLAALCYALLASAMPRAGGSYVNATRALNPFLGFLASFAQWFGLSIGMGVVAYLMVPMLRDLLAAAGLASVAPVLDRGIVRVPIALAAMWLAWLVNIIGVKSYQRTVVIMTMITIVGPIVMTLAGAMFTHADFEAALLAHRLPASGSGAPIPPFTMTAFRGTCVILFSSFIGFDAVSQAGGEARRPGDLARAILIAIGVIALYYVVFTWAVYHAVPWQYIYRESLVHDISAPGLLSLLLPRRVAIAMLLAVTVAILKVIPAVMLANSRMLYAFSADRMFPAPLSRIHPRFRTPHVAITVTAILGTASVMGCAIGGDFFLGVDILVISMLFNYFLMAWAVLTFPAVNPALYRRVGFMRSRRTQVVVASTALLTLGLLIVVQVVADWRSTAPWYLRSTPEWLIVMAAGSMVFGLFWVRLKRQGIDPRVEIFGQLPAE